MTDRDKDFQNMWEQGRAEGLMLIIIAARPKARATYFGPTGRHVVRQECIGRVDGLCRRSVTELGFGGQLGHGRI
jgi:hypothetical protein